MQNNFFSICESRYPYQETTALKNSSKIDTYSCCLNQCLKYSTEPPLCHSMCAQIFPSVKDRCAFKMKCWDEQIGKFNQNCLKTKKK